MTELQMQWKMSTEPTNVSPDNFIPHWLFSQKDAHTSEYTKQAYIKSLCVFVFPFLPAVKCNRFRKDPKKERWNVLQTNQFNFQFHFFPSNYSFLFSQSYASKQAKISLIYAWKSSRKNLTKQWSDATNYYRRIHSVYKIVAKRAETFKKKLNIISSKHGNRLQLVNQL